MEWVLQPRQDLLVSPSDSKRMRTAVGQYVHSAVVKGALPPPSLTKDLNPCSKGLNKDDWRPQPAAWKQASVLIPSIQGCRRPQGKCS